MTIATTSSSSASAAGLADTPLLTQTLGQDDFLKLLVTQLTSQDPLNPQTDTQFIAQMAQFTALEQAKTMQSDLAQMRNEQQLLQANDLLGRVVVLQTGADTSISGTVSGVQIEAGTPKIMVNGQAYELGQLLSITPAPIP